MAVHVRVPGDKSLTHRALILASLADGESRIRGALDAEDTRSTATVLRALGTAIEGWPGPDVRVRGRGLHGWRGPRGRLDCGNSGTTARLLLGALAGCPFEAVLTGDASLQGRPMRRVTAPLAAVGATFEEIERSERLPIRVRGARPLSEIRHDSPRASAQVKTALLLAGLTGEAAVRVSEPRLSRDHTERFLAAMGADLRVTRPGEAAGAAGAAGAAAGEPGAAGRTGVELRPVDRLDALDFTVPGDPSSAAFFLGLGAVLGPVRVSGVGLNPTRTGFLDVLRRMNVPVEVNAGDAAAGEPVGDIRVTAGSLGGTVVTEAEVPSLLDEIPLLAALGAVADGEMRFDGVAELRVKETDRVAALVENLRALGVEAEDGPEHLVVRGGSGPLRGRVRAFGDHRIAMAFGVLGAIPGNQIEIDGHGAVGISYPGFWEELERVRKELRA